jgi:hypothetical protein
MLGRASLSGEQLESSLSLRNDLGWCLNLLLVVRGVDKVSKKEIVPCGLECHVICLAFRYLTERSQAATLERIPLG